jgi:hypothetical protein
MTPEEFKDKMKEIYNNDGGDHERSHSVADDLMCEVLSSLGYDDGVQIYAKLERWYA